MTYYMSWGQLVQVMTDNLSNAEEWVYSEGLVRLIQLPPDISEETTWQRDRPDQRYDMSKPNE